MKLDIAQGQKHVELLADSVLVAPRSERALASGHIAIVLHDLRGGGAERACLRLARGLASAGRDVELILIRGEGAYLAEVPANIHLTVLNCPRVSRSIGTLAAHFRRTRPRVIFSALTHMNVATIAAARLAGTGARIVVSERNQISRKAEEATGGWQRNLYRSVPYLYRGADSVVAVSGGVADDLAHFGRLPKGKIEVIYNPVFDPDIDTLAQEQPAHPWFEGAGLPVILAAGRLHRQKGFDVLLRAFAMVRTDIPCRLVILGEGQERQPLSDLAAQLGITADVDMPGFAKNPFSLMTRSAAFVLSSRWEGFPNALVEAMACGTPVVATDCPSGPREILEGGRLAPLVAVDDANALATTILATLSKQPDTSASRIQAQRFSVAAAVSEYLRVFEG